MSPPMRFTLAVMSIFSVIVYLCSFVIGLDLILVTIILMLIGVAIYLFLDFIENFGGHGKE